MLQIRCKNINVTKSFPEGTSLLDVYQEFQNEINLPYPVVSAKVNNVSQGLKFRLFQNRDVEFLDAREGSGHRVYVRSLCFVLYKAVAELFPKGKILMEHPVSNGYFCDLRIGRGVTEEDVQAMIEPLNDIYRQVGVSFYLDSVMVTNIPAAFNLLYDEDPSGGWDFDKLVDIGQGTDGIECYFVNDFTMTDGRNPPLAANTYKGLVMSARADVTTLAHEIGHAFGLEDVYVSSAEKDEESLHAKDVSQCVICGSKATYDWNGGCYGTGVGGARYYPSGTTMAEIIPRLVMYGVGRRNAARRDITLGNVDGAWYQEIGSVRVWYDTEAPVGFFRNIQKKASPNHE